MTKSSDRPLILVTNDDGVNAKGLHHLIDCVSHMGDVIAVAPDEPQSGKSSALTVSEALRITRHADRNGAKIYSVSGTPVDCVKLALHTIVPRTPDMLLSGVNHGSNAAVNVIYSGTMGAAIEGALFGIPSIGYSLMHHALDADFSATTPFIEALTAKVLENGLPEGICLNVNIPANCTPEGMKLLRGARGYWNEGYQEFTDPAGHTFYMLSGRFSNREPECPDTDEYWLKRNWISIVPINPEMNAGCDIMNDLSSRLGL